MEIMEAIERRTDRWLSVSRMGSEGHYGAFTVKSLTSGSRVLLASDVRSENKHSCATLD